MSEAEALDLGELLEPRLPSAMQRHDRAAVEAGAAADELARAKAAVAALGLVTAPEAPPPSVRERVLASATRPGRFGLFADRVARLFDLEPAAAEALVARCEDDAAWMPFLVEGVSMMPVEAGPRCAGAIATLVRFQPGATFPEHAHRGAETMFVLDGGFCETASSGERGKEAWRGDELYSEDGSGHALRALEGVPCIAAVVISGHADFK